MVHKRRDFLITFTILCLAMCACSGFQYLGSAFYGLVWHRIHGLGSGGARLLSGLSDSPWTGVLVQYIFSIGVPFLLVILYAAARLYQIKRLHYLQIESLPLNHMFHLYWKECCAKQQNLLLL